MKISNYHVQQTIRATNLTSYTVMSVVYCYGYSEYDQKLMICNGTHVYIDKQLTWSLF